MMLLQLFPGAEQSQIDCSPRDQADICDLFRNECVEKTKQKDACGLCGTPSYKQEGKYSAQFVLHLDLVQIARCAQADCERVKIGYAQRLKGKTATPPALREIGKSQVRVEQRFNVLEVGQRVTNAKQSHKRFLNQILRYSAVVLCKVQSPPEYPRVLGAKN